MMAALDGGCMNSLRLQKRIRQLQSNAAKLVVSDTAPVATQHKSTKFSNNTI
jgi:hypothetical protein